MADFSRTLVDFISENEASGKLFINTLNPQADIKKSRKSV